MHTLIKRFNDLLILSDQNKSMYVPISQIVYGETIRGITRLHLAIPSSITTRTPINDVMNAINDINENTLVEINDSQFINKAYIKHINETERLITTSLDHKLILLKKY